MSAPRDRAGEPPPPPRAVARLKPVLRATALLWVSPWLLAYRVARRLVERDRAFLAASESLARVPGTRGVYCRQAFYRRTLARCGRDVYFGWLSTFSKALATVGDGAYIGRRCSVGLADIGAEVMLADGVQVLSGAHQHPLSNDPGRSHRESEPAFERIAIGAGAWIGAGAIVMADVGEGAVVGAGAVVNRAVPPRVVAVGVPARVARTLGPPSRC